MLLAAVCVRSTLTAEGRVVANSIMLDGDSVWDCLLAPECEPDDGPDVFSVVEATAGMEPVPGMSIAKRRRLDDVDTAKFHGSSTSWIQLLRGAFASVCKQSVFKDEQADENVPVTLETICSGIGTASIALQVRWPLAVSACFSVLVLRVCSSVALHVSHDSARTLLRSESPLLPWCVWPRLSSLQCCELARCWESHTKS